LPGFRQSPGAGTRRSLAGSGATCAGELAALITAEPGCPIWFSEKAHALRPIRHFRYYADHCRHFPYDERRTDGTNACVVTQVPVGVVGAITPWNGPLRTPSRKVAPALAAGCSVVLKPPPERPPTAYAMADAVTEAGLLEGLLGILSGDQEAGQHLVWHREVDKVAFPPAAPPPARRSCYLRRSHRPGHVPTRRQVRGGGPYDADPDTVAEPCSRRPSWSTARHASPRPGCSCRAGAVGSSPRRSPKACAPNR
jgi:hypothetical protein